MNGRGGTRIYGIPSLTQNPGSLSSQIWRHTSRLLRLFVAPLLNEPKFGAYTEAWAGLSPEVNWDDAGRYAIPWGRWHPSPRKDMLPELKIKEEGGTGAAKEFWEWCEAQFRPQGNESNRLS